MTYSQHDATRIWGQNAKPWREHFAERDPSRKDMLDPIILQLLGDVSNKRILDAGCGDGYLCRKLARLGAILVGVELSSEMLAFALEGLCCKSPSLLSP